MTDPLLTPYDTADYLDSPERIAAYLDAVLAEDDPALAAHAFDAVARARGLARGEAQDGAPHLAVVMGLLHRLGLRMSVAPLAGS
ncbi:transcriptional regulator [Methylobacterium terrae]|uniref:Transcriptional regulator n=1 Tax=Methylobacterium terrae TaxID=2202827 RepID=A0A2U8WUY9_9HYPH|nr:transcriptional regulator [Methylobacterium terrae]AWN50134.1 transcriptional regulator [Methylobacterium terrae]